MVYVKDQHDVRWYQSPSPCTSVNTEWITISPYIPNLPMWDEKVVDFGSEPLKILGFIANPGSALVGDFAIRDVKIYYTLMLL